jgi:hypothetical protein
MPGGSFADQLTEATFQQGTSIFENFFFELLRLWLTAHPESLARKTIEFKSVLDLPDKDALIQLVVRKELNDLLYKKPAEWIAYLHEKVKLGCPSDGEIRRIAEAKASRDVLMHHRGIANKTYEAKAGELARFRDGERIEIPKDYHRETWELIRKVVSDISDAAAKRAS